MQSLCIARLYAPAIKAILDAALSYPTVKGRMPLFKSGRADIKDESRPSRPLSVASDKYVAAVKTTIAEGTRYTVDGTESSAVFYILKEVLKLRKIRASWIPQMTKDKKRERCVY